MKLTLLLILINVAFFLYASYHGNIKDYAFTPTSLAEGKYLNIITAMFMHANVLHIVFNMIVLFFVGRVLENYISTPMYLLVYFSSGIIANLGVMLLPFLGVSTFVVGASAAISGLIGYGAFKLSGKWVISPIRFIPVPMPFIVAGSLYAYINLANALAGTLSFSVPWFPTVMGLSISALGHLIGGMVGCLIALKNEEHKIGKLVFFFFLIAFISFIPYLISYIVRLWI